MGFILTYNFGIFITILFGRFIISERHTDMNLFLFTDRHFIRAFCRLVSSSAFKFFVNIIRIILCILRVFRQFNSFGVNRCISRNIRISRFFLDRLNFAVRRFIVDNLNICRFKIFFRSMTDNFTEQIFICFVCFNKNLFNYIVSRVIFFAVFFLSINICQNVSVGKI